MTRKFYFVKIVEQRTMNSGISQGCIVSRQRVPRKISDDILTMLDLNVQKEVTIFDRTYKIIDCDEFTRKYLNRSGIDVPHPIELPE